MTQCKEHLIDVNNLAKQLYFSLTLSKVFISEINKESLSRLTICAKCYCLCYQGEPMKEHFKNTHQGHTLFIGVCPMRIVCIKCLKTFSCPVPLMKSIIYSLPCFPSETPPIGFYNLGNSCYSNSILIALSHCHPLVIASSVSSFPHLKVFNIAATANRQFNQVFHSINPKFSPFEQEDAAEFLLYVLDIFSNDSKCKSLFNGSTKTHFICNKCNNHTEIEQAFTVLSVPLSQDGWKGKKKNIPPEYIARNYGDDLKFGELGDGSFENHVVSFVQHFSVSTLSLEKSLQSLFSPHFEISNNGKLKKKKNEPLSKCEKCHGDNQMVSTLESLPEILVIHLERFGKRWFGLGKMYQSVSFPEDDADFSQFMPPTVDSGPFLYSLVAVVVHNGFMSSGHYMCYARKFGTKKWYLFNDHEVSEVSREEVLNSQAYILFYQKKPPLNVVEIRTRIAKAEVPSWAATPIKIFSNPILWRKSLPTIRIPIDQLRKIETRKKEETNNLTNKRPIINNNSKNNTNDKNNSNNNNNNTDNRNNFDDNDNTNKNENNKVNTNNDSNSNDNNNDNTNEKTNINEHDRNENINNNDNSNTTNITEQVHDYVSDVYDKLAPILRDASEIAGESVEREETEIDVRSRIVTLYPYSKSKVCVTRSSAEMFWEFVSQKGPIPFMIKSDFLSQNSQAVGDEVEFLISHMQNEINQNETNQNETNQNEINQNETNQNEINQNETNQNEINQNETNQNEINQNETNQNETNQNEINQNETNQNEINQNETNQNEINQNETNQNETNQNEINQNETNQNETNQNETNQNEINQNEENQKETDQQQTENNEQKENK